MKPAELVHFEIPVKNFETAKTFYGELFAWKFTKMNDHYWMIAGEGLNQIGAISEVKEMTTGKNMPVLYFSVTDINESLIRAEKMGAKIVTAKTDIGNNFGFYADILDASGNIIGLWSKA